MRQIWYVEGKRLEQHTISRLRINDGNNSKCHIGESLAKLFLYPFIHRQWRSKKFTEVELAVRLLYMLGEAIPAKEGNHFAGNSSKSEVLKDMMRIVSLTLHHYILLNEPLLISNGTFHWGIEGGGGWPKFKSQISAWKAKKQLFSLTAEKTRSSIPGCSVCPISPPPPPNLLNIDCSLWAPPPPPMPLDFYWNDEFVLCKNIHVYRLQFCWKQIYLLRGTLTRWRLVTSILGLGSMWIVC